MTTTHFNNLQEIARVRFGNVKIHRAIIHCFSQKLRLSKSISINDTKNFDYQNTVHFTFIKINKNDEEIFVLVLRLRPKNFTKRFRFCDETNRQALLKVKQIKLGSDYNSTPESRQRGTGR